MVRNEAIKEIMCVEDIHGFSDQYYISRNHFSYELVFAVAAAIFSFFSCPLDTTVRLRGGNLTQTGPKNFFRTLRLGV